MSSFVLRFLDACHKPLHTRIDIRLSRSRDNTITARPQIDASEEVQSIAVHADLLETYRLQVFPAGYRTVSRFVTALKDRNEIDIYCPIDPQRVNPKLPRLEELDLNLKVLIGDEWSHLSDLEKAGLLNIFSKMKRTPVSTSNVWNGVKRLARIRGDRLFADVDSTLRDDVKTMVAGGSWRQVSASLHTPPPGYVQAGSFKTQEMYGNLQLTFFHDANLNYMVDADIDDAAGIGHWCQVVDHAVTGGATHPYDIHQILTYYQGLNPGYSLHV